MTLWYIQLQYSLYCPNSLTDGQGGDPVKIQVYDPLLPWEEMKWTCKSRCIKSQGCVCKIHKFSSSSSNLDRIAQVCESIWIRVSSKTQIMESRIHGQIATEQHSYLNHNSISEEQSPGFRSFINNNKSRVKCLKRSSQHPQLTNPEVSQQSIGRKR